MKISNDIVFNSIQYFEWNSHSTGKKIECKLAEKLGVENMILNMVLHFFKLKIYIDLKRHFFMFLYLGMG